MSGSLDGRRVVVTRAAEQAGTFTAMLRAEGAIVIEVPLVQIEDPDDGGAALTAALSRLDEFDWLVVTSPNGAARVAAALAAHLEQATAGRDPLTGADDVSDTPDTPDTPGSTEGVTGDARSGEVPDAPRRWLRVAAVGSATAATLAPTAVDLVPERHIGEALVGAFPSGSGRVLLVQGDLARRAVGEGLTAKGWTVERVVGYRTVAVALTPQTLAVIADADALTLLSGSAARSLIAAGAIRFPACVVSIGPETHRAADEVGLTVTATAQLHTLSGMVATLTRILGESEQQWMSSC